MGLARFNSSRGYWTFKWTLNGKPQKNVREFHLKYSKVPIKRGSPNIRGDGKIPV